MKDADATVERLLAGLRDAEPSPGMQRRVLEAMETHPAAGSASPRRRLVWLRPAIALLLAGVVALTIKVHHHHETAPYIRSDATTIAPGQPAASKTIAQQAPARPRRKAAPASLRTTQTRDGSIAEQAPAAGFPAPPLPLTEQEKLLLRMAHRNDPENLALLNRDVQAAQSAKATEQFQHFFAIDPAEMRSESE